MILTRSFLPLYSRGVIDVMGPGVGVRGLFPQILWSEEGVLGVLKYSILSSLINAQLQCFLNILVPTKAN